ncbi:hypothetical protein JCM11251_007418 [Rhodosporidiobolus azoricus]
MAYTHLPVFAATLLWITTSAVSPLQASPLPLPQPHLPLTVSEQLQYGFHIAALNSLSTSIICADSTVPDAGRKGSFGLPACIEMSESAFGGVTSAYTVGGLVASLSAGSLIERWGKKGTGTRSAGLIVVGASLVSFGSSLWILMLGRVLIGMSCGIATVLVPLYLRSVAPPAVAGNIGILTQISINVGIFVAQGFSIPLSTAGTGNWRFVSLISAAVAAAQILTSPLMPENGSAKQANNSRIYDVSEAEDEERTPFAAEEDSAAASRDVRNDKASSLSVWDVLRSSDTSISKPMWTLVLVMLFQQLSGINAVMYYSTSILTAVNPSSAKTVSLFVTIVNLVATFPAICLVDRLGRRSLLLLSLSIMCLSTAVLGWSINTGHFYVASAFIMLFVVGFALGLGPVPFVLVGEMPVEEAKSATASVAVAVNWTSNLLVGIGFLPLRDYLASDGGGSGTVFYIFTICTAVGAVVLSRLVR